MPMLLNDVSERTALLPALSLETRRTFFEQLADEHGAAVLGTLRRLCGSRHDAEDLFQETATRVWRHLLEKPAPHNPRAWLMTVAYRVFLDGRAKRQTVAEPREQPDARHPPPEERAEAAETKADLDRHIAELPETLRIVVVLHYSSGLSLSETAEAIGISVGTAKSRLSTALAKLRSKLT